MIACIKVGHVQTLQADLPSGCLHFLKNCISLSILYVLCSREAQSVHNA